MLDYGFGPFVFILILKVFTTHFELEFDINWAMKCLLTPLHKINM